MKKWTFVATVTTCWLIGVASVDFGQFSSTARAADDGDKMQSTRADFKEFCKAMEGRWIGEVVWVADWPGFGKKGDKVTGYSDFRISRDGSMKQRPFNAGTGAGIGLYHYDAGKKQIQGRWVSSGGNVWNLVIYKKNGQWHEEETGSVADGRPIEISAIRHISDDGKTHRRSGPVKIDGKDQDPLQDVWRHVGN